MIVAGVDGAPGGWAVVALMGDRWSVRKVETLSALLEGTRFDIVAVDIPIGLLDAYEVGGRACDRTVRAILGKRASSVFPAPVRGALAAKSWEEACAASRASAPGAKAMSRQAFGILPKIREMDELLRRRPDLVPIVREVHPEMCFCELLGSPMVHRKSSTEGRQERRRALSAMFTDLGGIEAEGRIARLPIEDILDATAACWSAQRLARAVGRSFPSNPPIDRTGLPMAIWA